MIGVHPKALLNIDSLPRETRAAVMARTAGYSSPIEFYGRKIQLKVFLPLLLHSLTNQ